MERRTTSSEGSVTILGTARAWQLIAVQLALLAGAFAVPVPRQTNLVNGQTLVVATLAVSAAALGLAAAVIAYLRRTPLGTATAGLGIVLAAVGSVTFVWIMLRWIDGWTGCKYNIGAACFDHDPGAPGR